MSMSAVKQVLNSLPKNEVIYYRANPGNAGDSLIASGTFKLFREVGLNVKILENLSDFDATDKIVIYGGGGSFVSIYPVTRDFFLRHHKLAKQIILLPHTITENEDILKEFGSNVTLFARERVSYEHIKAHALNANLFLDHDLALQLNSDDVLKSSEINLPGALCLKVIYKLCKNNKVSHVPSIKKMFDNSLFEIKSYIFKDKKSANFFREDLESLSGKVPEDNADLSKIYEYGTQNEYLTQYATKKLMKYINQFSEIRTDRLHVCVAAALLNKQVKFYPNSYFKCHAVYEFSLKERFKNIEFVSKLEL